MKQVTLALLLTSLVATTALAQQPSTARVLTPAEQKQKEKIEREVQRERQIRAEWAQKQREYEAKRAEKERQKQAKKEGKTAVMPEPTPVAPTIVAPAPTNAPSTAPVVAKPQRKERVRKQKAVVAEPVPVLPTAMPEPVVVEKPVPVKAPRERRVRQRPVVPSDSAVVASGNPMDVTAVRAKKEFLPKGHLFDPIVLDPLESQSYGSILPGYWTEGKKYAGSIVPFAFGFAKPFYRRTTAPGRAEEWVLDVASFTQFEAYHDAVANKARRRIINTDYKISIIYNIRRGENNYRIRVYHLSSHLGDDYIFRNQITAPSPNSVNYELLDFTYSRVVNNWRVYGGGGIVLRNSEERKPLAMQIGTFYKRPSTQAARLVGGVDVKFWQQTQFRPGIHGGVGIELGRTQNNLTFLLEGYSGFRPYSQYEDQQTSWIGVGMYLNPF